MDRSEPREMVIVTCRAVQPFKLRGAAQYTLCNVAILRWYLSPDIRTDKLLSAGRRCAFSLSRYTTTGTLILRLLLLRPQPVRWLSHLLD